MSPQDAVSLLTNSPTRAEVLSKVVDGEATDVRGISAEVEATRRTVSRAFSTLEEAGCVQNGSDGYHPTVKGAVLLDAFESFRDRVETMRSVESIVANLPESAFDLTVDQLASADVIEAGDHSPYAILDRTLELRRSAERIREIAPSVEQKSVSQLAERIESGENVTAEIVIPESAIEAAKSHPDYADDHTVSAASDRVEFHVLPEPVEFFVGIFDDTAAVGTMQEGRPHALAESDEQAFRDWAVDTFEEFRTKARELEDGSTSA